LTSSDFLEQIPASLDRVSPVPFYFQIEQAIAEEIRVGRLDVGSRLPTEPALAEHFDVSRSVIRQALARLVQEGLVARRRGVGSFVTQKEPASWQLQGVRGFFEDEVARLGRDVVSDVLRAEVVPLPRWASDALELEEDALGAVLERLRYVDTLLTVYDLNYLPDQFAEAVLPLKGEPHGSLYGALRREYGLAVTSGRRTVDAVLAGPQFAELLEVEESAPLLFVEGVDLDAALRPFDCYRTWLRPDRLKIQVDVVPAATRTGQTAIGNRRLALDDGGLA
jgi:GntR family transcriptional regulator